MRKISARNSAGIVKQQFQSLSSLKSRDCPLARDSFALNAHVVRSVSNRRLAGCMRCAITDKVLVDDDPVMLDPERPTKTEQAL